MTTDKLRIRGTSKRVAVEWQLHEERALKTVDGRIWFYHTSDRRSGRDVYRYDGEDREQTFGLLERED